MIYVYQCKVCGERLEVQQGINDEHKYEHCGKECARVFEVKEVKKNEGFYSDMFGCYVNSQTEFNEVQERSRYMNDINKFLGNNATPKDEWIDQKSNRDSKIQKQQQDDDAKFEREHYGNIETFE